MNLWLCVDWLLDNDFSWSLDNNLSSWLTSWLLDDVLSSWFAWGNMLWGRLWGRIVIDSAALLEII